MMDDEEIIARTCWGEARSEGAIGMQAVASVILNRVAAKKWWGLTPTEVCIKPSQFSCWLPSDPNLPKLKAVTKSDPQYKIALDIAFRAINGVLPDITHSATHYKVVGTHAPWAQDQTPVCVIGHHEFYKLTS